jgi:ELWxxDGT repeat protein
LAGIEVHAPIVEVNGIAYFPGRTDSGDFHLWRSNGTAAGTYLLKNVALASNFSNPGYLANVNGTLFFRGDDGTNGPELWKSDGTSGGTVLVKDIDTGSRGSYPKMLANIGQTLFFTAYDGGSTGLWKTDGTAAGTVRIGTVRPEVIVTIGGPTPPQAAAVNGTLFFRGDDGVNGVELWKSDGTATGTMMVKDIRVSSGTSGIHYVTNVNGTAFFAANDGTSGYELWKSDGTTNNTVLVKDIFPGLGNSPYSSKGPSYFAEVNGKLFFRANDGTHGYELWKSDGSSDGTVLVKDIGAGASSGGIKSLANVSGTLFFASDDGGPGFGEVWKSDSTFDGTVLLKDVLATATVGLAPRYFTNVNGTLLFATSNNHTASELWRSNGTPESTVLVQSFPEATIGASAPHYLGNAGGKLFFAVPDGSGKPRLWTSDGTNSGTILVPQGNASCSTVVININDSGAGSLRDAINCANSSPGTDTISFNIPGAGVHTIALATQLPDLTEAVIIDGYTQPGANANTNAIDDSDATKRGFNGTLLIELSGGGNVPEGLNLANGSTVRGLVINRFGNNGINAGAGCIIEGNFIGTDPTGILDRGNSGNGVSVGGSNNRIGGASPAARNVISTNADYGIGLSWYGGSDETTGNLIAGNFIGIDASGSKALGNKRSGIFFYQVTGNTIGGTQAGARNVISGNTNNGVYIVSTIGVTVQGNYIGTDVSGSKPVGNGGTGISIDGFNGNVIGGAAAGAGNVISANQYGIVESAQYDTIQGNLIGTDAAGVAPLGNAHDGIRLLATTGPNQIGGTATGAGNHIAFNGGNGISFQAGYYYPNSGTPILGNSIFSNGGMGIDLGEDGPTVNDVGDPDTGPNNDQNSPVLQSVTGTGGATTTQWSFNSDANTQFRLEFFASAAADPSGYGEGQTFLGSTNVTTDPSGNAATTFSTPTPTGTVFSATATRLDAQGRPLETSEFSYTQLGSPTCNTTVTNTNDTGDGSFRAAILCANSNPGLDTIRFNIPGPGVHTIRPATTLPTITDSVIIDGYTQPGASPNTNAIDDPNPAMRGFNGTLLIELSGNGSISTGLPLGASNSVIRGLVVNSFFSGIGVGGRGNVIEGNFVGLDPTGTKSHANSVIGIDVVGSNHRIGGTTPASRNVVSSNGYDGIRLADFGNGGTGNVVQGNLVGTDLTGTKALGNQPTGVYLYQVGGDTVGGTQSGARNVISGNSTGIYLESSTGNTVQGNFIGVDVSGAKALGNSGAGIAFNVGGATMIGGTTPAARNVISGNGAGIAGYGSENVVQGNFIGTDASGTQPLGNTGSGISILRGSFDDVIGGTASGAANVIAYNGGSGVFIQESYRHSILANSIFSNAGLGIDIDPAGFNPNDPGDADNGANYQQNYPEISSVTRSGSTLSLTYVVPSLTTNSTYPLRVEFFKADGDGQEGQTFLGFDTYTAAEAGTAKTIVLAPAIPIGVGNQLVATATDNRNDTSEFSPGVTVGGANVPPVLVNINGNNSLTASESTVPLTAAPSIDVNLSASDSDFLQTLTFSLVVNPSPPPDCTAYDPSNSAQTSLLQISIPAQTASPGAPPNGTSSATGTLRVTPGPNAAGTWCFIVRTSDGIASDQHEVTLTVTSANSSPVITTNGGGDTANISVKENTTAVTDLDATDLDVEQTITFSIAGGADANKFSINGSTGVLIFASAPDFEQPVDAGSNNVYDVIVQASDGSLSDRQTIAVTVTNVNEPPVIVSNGGGSSASITIAENTTAVTDVDATDPDASTTLTYSKIGGVDSARFSISSTTGVLSFITAPNFESPTDAGRDNVYDVIVRVSDGSLSDAQTISVRVTNGT